MNPVESVLRSAAVPLLTWVLLALCCLPLIAAARLNVPELPALEGVDPEQGPFGVLEAIVIYCVYLVASLSVVWILLSVGKRVTTEFNEARRESGDFGRVVVTAFVGVAISLFIIFLANYLIGIIE